MSGRDLFKGAGRSAAVWACGASILLCASLLVFSLIADLLTSQGRLVLSNQELARLNQLVGFTIVNQQTDVGTHEPLDAVELDNAGILPAIYSLSRTAPHAARYVAIAYARVGALRDNATALGMLVLAAVVLGSLRILLLSRARIQSMRVALDAVTRLRRSIHRQALRLGPSDLNGTNDRQALTLFTDDMDRVRDGTFLWVYRFTRYPLELALLVAMALWLQWLVALECLIPLALCWYLIEKEQMRFESSRRLAEASAQQQLHVLAEGLRKTRLVRGYGMEAFEHEQFQKLLDQFRSKVESLMRGEGWSRWARWLMVISFVVLVLYLVGIKLLLPLDDADHLPFGSAAALLIAFAGMYRPLERLWELPQIRNSAEDASERIHQYLLRIPEVGQAVGARFLQPLSKSLQYESVSYNLPDKTPLLNGFDLKIPAGGTTAIVSLDPREAKAVAYLLPRFIEPQSGRILFDGEDIAWVTLESLRAETIYVGGNDPFFTGTVFQNISCGNANYTLQEVTEAAKQTHAHNFIVKLPMGYETLLGEFGHPLDPGESFRLSLARAVLRNPAVLVIEEPAELMNDDAKTLLDDAYSRVNRDRTVLFLPSRLSTLRKVNQIVLVHQGRAAAMDGYAQMVRSSQLYRHWEYMRFNEYRQPAATGK